MGGIGRTNYTFRCRPAEGAYSTAPYTLAVFKCLLATFKGGEGRTGAEGQERKGLGGERGVEKEGKGRKGREKRSLPSQ